MQNENGLERGRRNQEIVHAAVGLLDTFDSQRAIAANAVGSKGETYAVTLPDRRMTFRGTSHTNNPDAAGVVSLQADIIEILSTVDPRELVFMIEGRNGGIDTARAVAEMRGVTSIEEAVKKSGESGVALWKVAELYGQGIEVAVTSPEKPEQDIVESLRGEKQDGKFTAEEIAAYLAIRQMTNVFRIGIVSKSPDEMRDSLARDFYEQQMQTGVDWIKDVKPTDEIAKMSKEVLRAFMDTVIQEYVDGLNAWLKSSQGFERDIVSVDALLNQDEGLASMKDINELHDPLDIQKRHNRINAVSAAWNGERDKYLVEQIGKIMATGKKPYVIYGASHATHCEPALRKLADIS